jgi:hypothetical protein
MSPEAAFDTLAIIARLEPTVGRVLPSEVHLFAYLACLLSLYSGRPVADWGYPFTGTAEGSPFGASVNDALTILRGSGDVIGDTTGLGVSDSGRGEYELLRTLPRNATREEFVAGACSSVLALPMPVVRTAMQQEPALRRVTTLAAARPLLESVDVDALYEQFHALASVVGTEIRDVMVPAVAWLMYLVRVAAAESRIVQELKTT